MNDLEDNLKAFQEQLPRLLETDEGRFAVVGRKPNKEGYEFSCWDTFADANQYGYQEYGLNPFLIKQVERVEIPLTFTRNIL